MRGFFLGWVLKGLLDAFQKSRAETEASLSREDAARNARRSTAIEDGCRLREIFTGMSEEQQQKWAAKADLYQDYRFKSPTFVPLWDKDSTWGVCVPGKHDEAKIMDVTVRRKDGATTAKQVGVMFAACHELENKQRWVSVCMIIE